MRNYQDRLEFWKAFTAFLGVNPTEGETYLDVIEPSSATLEEKGDN